MQTSKQISRKCKIALSLGYDSVRDDATPYISVIGKEKFADLILQTANFYKVPIVENSLICRTLQNYKEGTSIPEHLFKIVAVIFHNLEKIVKK